MSKKHTEETFETAIVTHLTSNGYRLRLKTDLDIPTCFDVELLLEFLKVTQTKEWQQLTAIHKDNTEKNIIARLVKEIELRGCLDVIRKGFTDYGVKFKLAYFKPETSFNQELINLYNKNILSVARQVKYTKENNNELDLVFFVNGIPVATAELKNQFTGQTVSNAKVQYKFDRNPKEILFQFNRRALVHFVIDTDEIYLTTKLEGNKTFYIPFNKGNAGAAGNPVNENGYRTSYLWEDSLLQNAWLDIIGKFLHLEVKEEEVQGRKIRKEKLIFPRYHQLDVVRKITTHTKENGAGCNYLIQHSAGSGKSNSIAWLAYRLANQHNVQDEKIFTSVIVITDRRVLDTQLQNTIYQFEHKLGVVQKIDVDSKQLAEHIIKGTNIIITTLQKFPEIVDKVGELPNRKYAIIVDEAHSSQGGEAGDKLKLVLAAKDFEQAAKEEADKQDEENYEDVLRKSMQAKGRKPNLSFFAFTATPKLKTLEVFGVIDAEGKPHPFHLYSMRQAIEEGFIMDVLKGYTTYKLYYQLNKESQDDPNISKKKGARAAARFVSFHPHNLAQKTQIIVEHFRQVVIKKIGGRAKAIVVTSSRLHAVRYKQEFDTYIKENKYADIKALVAFSGTVVTPEKLEYTESQMNGFGEKELPKKFDTNDYQVLIVAEKYQTGFDQPLLHTMYVDKKLSGVKAVQTLSRLNRTCPGKEDTFVLDFVNEHDDIRISFQPYYEETSASEITDPNYIYNLKYEIEQAQIIWMSEVEEFNKVFYNPYFTAKDQEKLNRWIDPAVERFKQLPREKGENLTANANQEDLKHTLQVFIRTYSFLTQIVNYNDIELDMFHTYCKYLIRKLPKEHISEGFQLNDEVALQYYRLQKVGERNIELEKTGVQELESITAAGVRTGQDEKAPLSEIISTINKRFATDFTDADRLLIQQIVEDCTADSKLADQAKSNTIDNFKFGFDDVYMQKWIERMDQNQELFLRVMENADFSGFMRNAIMKEVYKRLST